MKIGAIIYSRLNSRRLHQKGLLEIGGKKLIDHVIDRTKKIKNIENIILATSKSKIDYKLEDIAKKKKILFFQGSEKNVLKRTNDCLKKYKFDFILRICGDRIFFDNIFINNLLKKIKKNKHKLNKYDIFSNLHNGRVDPGLTIEIISKKCLNKMETKFKLSTFNKEHITSFIYQNLSKFKISKIRVAHYHSKGLKYTIDNKKDVIFAKKTLSKLNKNDLYKFKKIYEVSKMVKK